MSWLEGEYCYTFQLSELMRLGFLFFPELLLFLEPHTHEFVFKGRFHKTKTCLEALCHYGQRFFFLFFFFYISVIKTPGDLQNILDRAFWFFLKADYGTLLYSLYLAFFSFLRFFLFFISLQSNVKCKILEKKQKSKEKHKIFSFSVRKVVCLVPF